MAKAETPPFFDPRNLARLQGLRLRARHIVEGFVAGLHRSPFRGYSIEFSEHREYAPGDDLRYVDWKVLGRTDRFMIKQFEDETNLVCHLLLDVSESMNFASAAAPLSKLEYGQMLAAALGYLVLLGQDAAGVMTLDREVRAAAPAARSAEQLGQLLEVLETPDAPGFSHEPSPAVSQAMLAAASQLRRRGVVVLISDLLDEAKEIVHSMAMLRRQRHDFIVMHLVDPAEEDFPFDAPTLFHGLEGSGDMFVDGRKLRSGYQEAVRNHQETLRRGCHAEGADYVLLRTDEPVDGALAAYLARRAQRVR